MLDLKRKLSDANEQPLQVYILFSFSWKESESYHILFYHSKLSKKKERKQDTRQLLYQNL